MEASEKSRNKILSYSLGACGAIIMCKKIGARCCIVLVGRPCFGVRAFSSTAWVLTWGHIAKSPTAADSAEPLVLPNGPLTLTSKLAAGRKALDVKCGLSSASHLEIAFSIKALTAL